jgi:chemotaxis protein methyltransferase CheR
MSYIVRTSGLRFDLYKQPCLHRRLEARMRLQRMDSYVRYLRFLRAHPEEMERLVHALTINVSRFFRNPESFQALERHVLGGYLGAGAKHRVRMWSAGTAAGEEAYSLAILWQRVTQGESDPPRLELTASDIDAASLARARKGVYGRESLADVEREDLARFFTREGESYRVKPELSKCVRFVHADLIARPCVGPQDLILCRNVLIYFDRPLQETLCESLLSALSPGGYLMLGKVETLVGPARQRFEAVDIRERIFRKRREASPANSRPAGRGGREGTPHPPGGR